MEFPTQAGGRIGTEPLRKYLTDAKLLVLSNGAGEDAIARKVLDHLPAELQARVVCCPLVGQGSAFKDQFELCGPRVISPSEGLFRESWSLALRDLAQGVIMGHLRQLRFLREVSDRVGMTLAVGDLFPVLLSGLSGSRRTLFVGTAKSVFHHPYSLAERFLLRLLVSKSIVRDAPTAQRLADLGLNAQWLGNAMMDEVQPQGIALPFQNSGPVLTLFPGSRQKAPDVLAYQLEVLRLVSKRNACLQAGVAVAPGTQVSELVKPSLERGFVFEPGDHVWHKGALVSGSLKIHLLAGVLGDLLCASTLALGQAGTANEQAAGAGVPVVAYDPKGEKGLRWYRKRQKGLLGDAVRVVTQRPDAIADEISFLLTNTQERERRAQIGRERMGPPGGCKRMADAVVEMWPHI